MNETTRWSHLLAWFFAGVFLMNAVPHLVNGVSGSPFQSPFATPPGEGLSPATSNVGWACFNLVVGYALCRVGTFDWRKTSHAGALGLGAASIAFFCARHFGPFHGGA